MYNVWRASDESVMLIWEVKKKKEIVYHVNTMVYLTFLSL